MTLANWWLVQLPLRLKWVYTWMFEPIFMDFFSESAKKVTMPECWLFVVGGQQKLWGGGINKFRNSKKKIEDDKKIRGSKNFVRASTAKKLGGTWGGKIGSGGRGSKKNQHSGMANIQVWLTLRHSISA